MNKNKKCIQIVNNSAENLNSRNKILRDYEIGAEALTEEIESILGDIYTAVTFRINTSFELQFDNGQTFLVSVKELEN